MLSRSLRFRLLVGVVALLAVALGVRWWGGAGESSTPEVAQVATAPEQSAAISAAPGGAAAAEGAVVAWQPVEVSPAVAQRLQAVRVTAASVQAVRIELAALSGKASPAMRPGQGRWQFPLPSGAVVTGWVDRTTPAGPDAWVSEGPVEGVPGARWVMAAVRGRVSASIDGLPGGEVKVRTIDTAEGLVAQLYVVDPTLAGDCVALGEAERPVIAADVEGAAWAPVAVEAVDPDALASGDAIVDVLVAYTAAVGAELGSAESVEAEARVALSNANYDFIASALSLQLRLAGIVEVDLTGDASTTGQSGWQRSALESLAGVTDGVMDNVHAAREATGADLVTLVVQRPDPASSGIAYVLERLGHASEPYFAFSVVNLDSFSNATTLSHEFGHNLGCAHDRDNAGSLPARGYHGAFPGAYGYRVSGLDTNGVTRQVRSIMAYSPGTRLRFFSSPEMRIASYTFNRDRVDFVDPVVLGVALTEDPDHAADNVSVINRTAFQVASYRVSPTRSYGGRLVNVSTRAYVGSGYRTLTGGFVVTGEAAQRVLVRAPGPVLASDFGLSGALADPLLRVNQLGGGVVAENDNWAASAGNAAAVSAAGATAGAFAFPAGSRDAALVVDLAPGAYSAEVTGVGGATGLALVEAYEVRTDAAASARVVNLSTRAYASTATPIVAGFVVAADEGGEAERKTMFVRVRGPSLVNYGLPAEEVMPDPMIEIYDDEARLVFVNDDWDSVSAVYDSTIPAVSRGEVDQASEEAVYAAAAQVGATDMLAVEPAAVIELPAGLYTMFVRPYTDDDDPEGEPGVAIVEVFELER